MLKHPGVRRLGAALVLASGLGLLGRRVLGGDTIARLRANARDFDLPSAGLYDAIFGTLFEGFFARVADEAAGFPQGRLLEVGSGAGRLAVRLAKRMPGIRLSGVDISPDMVARAKARAARAGLADQVGFEVGDVARLPYPDSHFDAAVATFTLHHWADPVAGLAELHRVLKPGGEAWIYEVPAWLWHASHAGPDLTQLAASSPFGAGVVDRVAWPGPIRAVRRLRLRREGAGTPSAAQERHGVA